MNEKVTLKRKKKKRKKSITLEKFVEKINKKLYSEHAQQRRWEVQ